MADQCDRAAELQQTRIDDAISAHQRMRAQQAAQPPRVVCAECGEVIPPAVRGPGVRLCLECLAFERGVG